jgi:hypothetical protein
MKTVNCPWESCLAGVTGILLALSSNWSAAQVPGWWAGRQVTTNLTARDYALANQGQAKWMATNAYLEFVAHLPGGAGSNIWNVVSAFSSNGDYQPLNLGQLKQLAKPFYDRIHEVAGSDPSITNALPVGVSVYPWTSSTNDDANYSPVNIGQLKYTFSFNFNRDRLVDFLSVSLSNRVVGMGFSNLYWMSPKTILGLPPYNLSMVGYTNFNLDTNSLWAGVRGLDSIMFWAGNTSTGRAGGAVLVSPRHILACKHGGFSAGTQLRFMGTNGQEEVGTVVAYQDLATSSGISDAQVGILDHDMTNTSFMRSLPINAANYMTSGIPIVARSQSNFLWVAELSSFSSGIGITTSSAHPGLTQSGAVGGDSGSPIMVPFGNELVVASAFYTPGGANWNTAVSNTLINAAMSNLSVNAGAPVYQLTPASFEGYLP